MRGRKKSYVGKYSNVKKHAFLPVNTQYLHKHGFLIKCRFCLFTNTNSVFLIVITVIAVIIINIVIFIYMIIILAMIPHLLIIYIIGDTRTDVVKPPGVRKSPPRFSHLHNQ